MTNHSETLDVLEYSKNRSSKTPPTFPSWSTFCELFSCLLPSQFPSQAGQQPPQKKGDPLEGGLLKFLLTQGPRK